MNMILISGIRSFYARRRKVQRCEVLKLRLDRQIVSTLQNINPFWRVYLPKSRVPQATAILQRVRQLESRRQRIARIQSTLRRKVKLISRS